MITSMERELTETELDHVAGGAPALSHEDVHADRPTNGGHPQVAIIAILIGL
jgi:hypothetical protein